MKKRCGTYVIDAFLSILFPEWRPAYHSPADAAQGRVPMKVFGHILMGEPELQEGYDWLDEFVVENGGIAEKFHCSVCPTAAFLRHRQIKRTGIGFTECMDAGPIRALFRMEKKNLSNVDIHNG